MSQNPYKGYQFSEVSSHLGAKKTQTLDVHFQNDRSKPLEHENVRLQNEQNQGFQLTKQQDTYLKDSIPCRRFE